MGDPVRKLERARRDARRFAEDARRLARRRGKRLTKKLRDEIAAAADEVDRAAEEGDADRLSPALHALDALWGEHLAGRTKPLWREYGEAIAVAVLLAAAGVSGVTTLLLAAVALAAADHELGHHVHAGLLDGFGKAVHHLLGDLELRATVGAHLLFGCKGLCDTDPGDFFGFCLCQCSDLSSLLHGTLVFSFALVGLHGDAQLRFGNIALLFGTRFSLTQLALFGGCGLLAGVGLDLLHGDLALAELGQDGFNGFISSHRGRRANQHFLELQVVVLELIFHILAGARLDLAALLDELDQGAGLADVLEVGAHHRIEGLLHEALDVAETLDDEGRLAVVDVHDHRQRRRAGLFPEAVQDG